ncbi:eukaryotic translation initiation factor 5A-1-like [Ylistrum balloti]|uniref:eukaryotic translation initiation factor 5A-1-like n=1 Tax=Ylistrum balloti TaxID=509963 RepID=UPI002905DD36|nr:eukaryotic translation initiation factor 5A-1-like [Ylistrum balloti]
MGDQEDIGNDFESGESGASNSFPTQCSALRKNGHVLLKGRPCKIIEMSTSKTGKHGHAKVHLVGIDIFTGKKYEDVSPSTHNMSVPNVTRLDYQCVDIQDGFASLMSDDGNLRSDLTVPKNEVGEDILKRHTNDETFMVTVLKAMGEEIIVGTKQANNAAKN